MTNISQNMLCVYTTDAGEVLMLKTSKVLKKQVACETDNETCDGQQDTTTEH
jgi:hypothetical protein